MFQVGQGRQQKRQPFDDDVVDIVDRSAVKTQFRQGQPVQFFKKLKEALAPQTLTAIEVKTKSRESVGDTLREDG